MDSNQDGARPRGEAARQSLYALVIYLPDPLGSFLDHLRLDLVPGCNPHAHVSVLPPRPLPGEPTSAIDAARRIVAGFEPFEVELGQIEKFDATDVIYISVENGAAQLREMYTALNRGELAYTEPFCYHPHVTLAQEIPPESVEPLREAATRHWRAFPGPRTFRVDTTVFVRNTRDNIWVDLVEGPLRGVPVGSR
ncbi:MAG TPA: 2'-5' RNA ligase family protein [Bryobacteraceae bacterium]|nr:2'-5' RNA ligase family protein [Bryobacteraceae bacterium]